MKRMLLLAVVGLLGISAESVPVSMVWQFNAQSLSRRQYLKDIDFIRANTWVDSLWIAPLDGVNPEDADQFHDAFKELVDYAKTKGMKTLLRQKPGLKGFFNASVDGGDAGTYVLDNPQDAQGIAYESEVVADAQGFARVTETAKWARNKIRPLRNELLAVWSFEKTADGFYRPDSLVDVTAKARIVARTSASQSIEIDEGTAYAGRTFYVLTAQYFNAADLFGDAAFRMQRQVMDGVKDVPLAGYYQDEFGYLLLNVNGISAGKAPPWRGRFYSAAQADWWRAERNTDLKRLLFDMRYAPMGDPSVRIRAINSYMDVMRRKPAEVERAVVAHQKKLWGDDVLLACHTTFHNSLGADEVWHTGCNWWEIPRDYGFVDECIDHPTRMGVLYGAKKPFVLHMYYSKKADDYYRAIVGMLPFNNRIVHHAYNDGVWGKGYQADDLPFLANIRKLDVAAKMLEDFQAKALPRMDVLVVFGMGAQMNWYPDAKARTVWDINGTLGIQEKASAIWNAGYRCALIPDTMVEEGKLQIQNGTFVFNGHAFKRCLFLYPQYAKKPTWRFLDAATDAHLPLAVVGRADMDFDAEPVSFRGTRHDTFSLDILVKLGCPMSAIPGGAVTAEGGFSLVSDAMLTGKPTEFDFTLDGVRYTGRHTGVLAFRPGEPLLMTPGGALWADGKGVVDSGGAKRLISL